MTSLKYPRKIKLIQIYTWSKYLSKMNANYFLHLQKKKAKRNQCWQMQKMLKFFKTEAKLFKKDNFKKNSNFGKVSGSFFFISHIYLLYDLAISILTICPRENKYINPHKNQYTNTYRL